MTCARITNASGPHLGLNAVAINSTQSFEVATDGYNQLILYVEYTYSAATAVLTTLTEQPEGLSANYTLQEETADGGTVTLADRSYTHAPGGADADYMFGIPVAGAGNVTVNFSSTGGDGSDLVTVYYKLATL